VSSSTLWGNISDQYGRRTVRWPLPSTRLCIVPATMPTCTETSAVAAVGVA
jgi:hypothetical protein